MTQLFKQPAEQILVPIDFTAAIGADTIAEIVAVTITPRGLVPAGVALSVAEQAFAGQEVRLKLAGGTLGELYLVKARIRTTSAAQVVEDGGEVMVFDLGFTVPDGTTPYLSIQSFVERCGIRETIKLTDETKTGRINKERLIAAILDAQGQVDTALSGRFTTPLPVVPREIERLVYDLALARLWGAQAPSAVSEAASAARAVLREFTKGAPLPGAELLPAAPASVSSSPVYFESGSRLFDRDSMRGL